MTFVLSFRTQDVAGSIGGPVLYDADMTAGPPRFRLVPRYEWDAAVRGRRVLFATHGFNVDGPDGTRSLVRLGAALGLGPSDVFVAMIWPGDWWVPAINYPFEGDTARHCGQLLAQWCRGRLDLAAAVGFASHSLGARFVLEAVSGLDRNAALVCLMAGAINRDCLDVEYQIVRGSADAIAVLASRQDVVLSLAFPVGDLASAVLWPDHVPLTAALGRHGPPAEIPGLLATPWQIPDAEDFGHGSYLPNDENAAAPDAQWRSAAGFLARAWHKQPQIWPR